MSLGVLIVFSSTRSEQGKKIIHAELHALDMFAAECRFGKFSFLFLQLKKDLSIPKYRIKVK
jgi:hypothetical protein